MRTRVVSIFAVIGVWLAVISPVVTHAQSVSTPLIVAIGGNQGSDYDADLWEWTGAGPLTQLTHSGHNGNPALSLDGRYVAYLSLPDQMLSYLISLKWTLASVYPANR